MIHGVDGFDQAGYAVSRAGDVNADGFDDLLIGARGGDPNGTASAGETYVLFGRQSGIASPFQLSSIDGTNGLVINGVNPLEQSGFAVNGGGDVNGDGFADLIIGAPLADPNGIASAGRSYVVFGRNFTGTTETQIGDAGPNALHAGQGSAAMDVLVAADGADTLVSDGGPDVLIGGRGDDTLALVDTEFSSTRRLDGGTGFDTIHLTGAFLKLDLTAIADNRIIDVEQIDLNGFGANVVTLNVLEVLNISNDSNTLIVRGNAGDMANIGIGWTQGAV